MLMARSALQVTRLLGRGTTVLAVVRAGTLRVADAILCGSMSGKAREIARDRTGTSRVLI